MVKVKELIVKEAFLSFELYCGHNGMNKEINSVGILDYEALEEQFDLFHGGDFILSTLAFAKKQPELAENALIQTINRGVSAIGIKKIYYDSLSEKTIMLANQRKVPIFFFDDTTFEEIIVTTTDEIRRKEHTKYYESQVDLILKNEFNSKVIVDSLFEINSSFQSHSLCLYCVEHPPKTTAESKLPSIINKLRNRKIMGISSVNNSIFKYKGGILIIHTYNKQDSNPNYHVETLCRNIGMSHDDFIMGFSTVHHEHVNIAQGINEALSAARFCMDQQKSYMQFSDLGIYKFLIPIMDSQHVKSYVSDFIDPILNHDRNTESQLLKTAQGYIAMNGELKKTADQLFQHVNTVRYRINKIKELLCFNNDDPNFYEELFIAIKVYELQQSKVKYPFKN